MYRDGVGVKKDAVKAVDLFNKAAEQGLNLGQINLGLMYINGNGVKKDLVKAKYWINKAKEGGSQEASKLWETNKLGTIK